jgi:hypothetical protein
MQGGLFVEMGIDKDCESTLQRNNNLTLKKQNLNFRLNEADN